MLRQSLALGCREVVKLLVGHLGETPVAGVQFLGCVLGNGHETLLGL